MPAQVGGRKCAVESDKDDSWIFQLKSEVKDTKKECMIDSDDGSVQKVEASSVRRQMFLGEIIVSSEYSCVEYGEEDSECHSARAKVNLDARDIESSDKTIKTFDIYQCETGNHKDDKLSTYLCEEDAEIPPSNSVLSIAPKIDLDI